MRQLLLAAAGAVALTGCVIVVGADGFDGDYEATRFNAVDFTQASAQTLEPFTQIDVEEGTEVTLVPGNSYTVELDDVATAATRVRINGDTLVVDCAKPCGRGSRGTVLVTVPTLTAVDASTGASVKAEGGFAAVDALAVSVSTGGTADVRALKASSVSVSASTGGTAEVTATASIAGSASTGGSVTYWGNPPSVSVSKSTGGSVRAAD